MNLNTTRMLGRTGIALKPLAFGGAPLGDMFSRIADAQAHQTLEAAWNGGLRHFDTSPWYGRGQSEHRFGRFLYDRPRRDFVLSTKVGRLLRPTRTGEVDNSFWAGGLRFDIVFDYSYDGIMRSYEDSLQRLGMDRVDLLLIHDLDFWHHQTEARVTAYLSQLATSGWRALAELREQGTIRGIGAGINEMGMIPRFLDLMPVDFFLVALRYSLLDQRPLEKELPLCTEHGCGIICGGVFNSGILATGAVKGAKYDYADAPADIVAKVSRIGAICHRHDVSMIAAALQFPLGNPIVASVLTGAAAPEQIAQNLEAMQATIPDAFWQELKEEGLLDRQAPTP